MSSGPPIRVMQASCRICHDASMDALIGFSEHLAGIVDAGSASVVQVHGRRRPASGLVFRDGFVLTTTGALGREEGLRIRDSAGHESSAEVTGWDAATSLVLLKAPDVHARVLTPARTPARVGHLAVALARSWTNAVTATLGVVSVIGGPLRTGRGRSIDRVIRTSAPMHAGFAGGALLDARGELIGVATAAEIRGLGVVIPAEIAWTIAAALAEHGTTERGYFGVAGQPVRLPGRQRGDTAATTGVLVVGVSENSPADTGGILVGDIIVAVDDHAIESPIDLLEWLAGQPIGRAVAVRLLRGGAGREVAVTVGRRPAR
jgi:serine protease DegS/serine protease DegQ